MIPTPSNCRIWLALGHTDMRRGMRTLALQYVASTEGRLTLHFLPGYAPDLNPDELVWSHVKRTGAARTPLRKGEKLRDKIDSQLAAIKASPVLVRSFFQHPTVAYNSD